MQQRMRSITGGGLPGVQQQTPTPPRRQRRRGRNRAARRDLPGGAASDRANKLRSFLTMLGIIIGVGAVITMVALGSGAQKSVQRGSRRSDQRCCRFTPARRSAAASRSISAHASA